MNGAASQPDRLGPMQQLGCPPTLIKRPSREPEAALVATCRGLPRRAFHRTDRMHINNTSTTNLRAAVALPRHHIRTAANLLSDTSIHPRKPIFGDWLLERGLAMLYAPSGIGKSWLSLSIAAAIAGGGKLHEWTAGDPERVLLVDGEMDASDLKDRLGVVFGAVKGDIEKAKENLLVWARKDPEADKTFPDLATEDGRQWLLAVIEEQKPTLIILDNLSTLATVPDENSASCWDPLLSTLIAIQQAGCAVLLVHHARKNANGSSAYRGSQKLSVLFDIIMALKENPLAGDVKGSAFCLTFEKSRGLTTGTGYQLEAKFESQPNGGSKWSFESCSLGQIGEMINRVRAGEFATQDEIARAYGVNKATISRWKTKAVGAGMIAEAEFGVCLREARRGRPSDPFKGPEQETNSDF